MDCLDGQGGPRNRRECLARRPYRTERASRDPRVHLLDPRGSAAHGLAGEITEGLDLNCAHDRC